MAGPGCRTARTRATATVLVSRPGQTFCQPLKLFVNECNALQFPNPGLRPNYLLGVGQSEVRVPGALILLLMRDLKLLALIHMLSPPAIVRFLPN
jgi:hypothetical protein